MENILYSGIIPRTGDISTTAWEGNLGYGSRAAETAIGAWENGTPKDSDHYLRENYLDLIAMAKLGLKPLGEK